MIGSLRSPIGALHVACSRLNQLGHWGVKTGQGWAFSTFHLNERSPKWTLTAAKLWGLVSVTGFSAISGGFTFRQTQPPAVLLAARVPTAHKDTAIL